uniref:Uncharacterized protein n=1 Tax=viral metagenome TaxID=1070528 RepID=A0A6C0CMV6_9ZZZZ
MWECFLTSWSLYYIFCCGSMISDLCLERFYFSQEPPVHEYVFIEYSEN